MKTQELSKASKSVAAYARDARKSPVVFTRGTRPVAALVNVESSDWETVSLSTNPKFIALLRRSRQRGQAEGGLSTEQLRARLAARRGKSKPVKHRNGRSKS